MLVAYVALIISIFLPLGVLLGFYLLSKNSKFEENLGASFECGYTSYFYSRFSFSIQYFMVALIFLLLDLELCLIFPAFVGSSGGVTTSSAVFFMVSLLLWGLLVEWSNEKLEWVS